MDAARERGRRGQARRRVRPARERRLGRGRALSRTRRSTSGAPAPSSSARATRARSTSLAPAGAAVEHRVIPWDEVTLDDGTGIVHIAPGCGSRGLRALARARPARADAGRRVGPASTTTTAGCTGSRRSRRREQIIGDLEERGLPRRGRPARAPLPGVLALPHAADLPHLRRLVHRRRRAAAAAAGREREGRVDARVHGQAHGRLAREHGRLEHLAAPLLRAAAAVLPVRLRAPERDRLEGRAGGAGARRPRPARGAAAAVDRRRPDPLRAVRRGGAADPRGRRRLARRRHRPVLDARLAEPRVRPEGYATGAAKGLTTADLPDHAYWEQWFPADWVSEMREQIRLWFYSQLFMSVVLDGPRAVQAGARLREDARRDGPRDARLVGEHDRRPRTRSRAWAPT